MISIIVAIDQHNAIGKQGDLLCHLPNDLKHFKTITSGHTVIMGKRTYFSLPVHPLPNRRNIVITDIEGEQIEGAETAYSIQQAVEMTNPDEENFVIGGGMVYKQFMNNDGLLTDKLYITHIHHTWDDADTFFPEIKPTVWQKISEQEQSADDKNPYNHTFTEYTKL